MEFTGERFILGKAGGGIETEHLHRYYSVLNMIAGKTVLDAACGEGFGSSLMAKTAKHVWGIDLSEEAVNYARNKYQRYNLNYKQGSIEKLTFEDHSFDVIVSFETIEHVNESVQDQFLNEIERVLKKDGTLIISTPDKYLHTDLPKHENPFHVKEFYFNEFEEFLKKKFKFIEFFNQSIGEFGLILNYEKEHKENINLIDKENFDRYGKYIIAVCSNVELPNKNVINSLFEKEEEEEIESNINGDIVQVYLDNNKDFIEYNSGKVSFNYSTEFQNLCVSLPDHAYGRIRIDIGNKPCIFKIKKEMIIKSKSGVTVENMQVDNFAGVVRLKEDGDYLNFISMSDDPQIILSNVISEEAEDLKIFLELKVESFSFDLCMRELNNSFGAQLEKE